jgi:hypothetical protein
MARIVLHSDVLSEQAENLPEGSAALSVDLVQAAPVRANELSILATEILEVQNPETLLADLDRSGKVMSRGDFRTARFLKRQDAALQFGGKLRQVVARPMPIKRNDAGGR